MELYPMGVAQGNRPQARRPYLIEGLTLMSLSASHIHAVTANVKWIFSHARIWAYFCLLVQGSCQGCAYKNKTSQCQLNVGFHTDTQ